MTNKEQYLELEDSAYLPSYRMIKKRKPGWDDEETDIYPQHPDVRQVRRPILPVPRLQLEWLGFRRLVEDWREPIQRPILQMFMVNNGPMSVARGVKNILEVIRNKSAKSGVISSEILIDAYGTTFERLACYWLKINANKDRKLLDVGSTQRLAYKFRRNLGIYIMPDGFIIKDDHYPPLIEAACEYKTNPNDPRSNESLNRQLEQLVDFFTRFGNKSLHAGGRDRFFLDYRTHWVAQEIQIAARPSIVLVIPQDRNYEPQNEFVEVRKAPFSIGQLGKIVHTLLEDIHGSGYIDQELALFEERRLKDTV